MGNCNSVDPVEENSIEEKSSPIVEETPHSFFEVNGYKGCLKRIENGDKVVEQLINFLESRSEVEDVYAKRLHDWDEKVKGKIIQKCDQFSQKVLLEITSEAEINRQMHKAARERLRNDIEALKTWRKEHYPKKTFGGLKETDNLEKQFKEVTQPYQHALTTVETTKKAYYDSEIKLESVEARLATDPDNSQLLQEKTAAENARNMAKIEYENAVNSITKLYPTYEEQMKQLFNRIQDMEKKRMLYIKEIARRYITAVDLTDTNNLQHEYDRVKSKIENFSPDEIIDDAGRLLISQNEKLPTVEEYKPKNETFKQLD